MFGGGGIDYDVLAMDKDAGQYLESDETLAEDDDPLADIKAAWIMSGERIEDFSILKFNKKLRLEEKKEFSLNFIRGTTDYEEKMDILKRMKRREMKWGKLKETSVWMGKTVGKELLTLGKNAAHALEPSFMRRDRRRRDHLRRIEAHEARALAISKERLTIERDRAAMRFKKAQSERERGLLLDHMKPSEDLKMALDRVASTRKRELDLMAFRARRQRDVDERVADSVEINSQL